MKKIIILLIVIASVPSLKGQINVPSEPNNSISQENPFLDASGYVNFDNNIGKGLYFPKTDLTSWEFITSNITPGQFSTYFDGMIVYNYGEGQTVADATLGGQQVTVEQGFYYFYNPDQTAPTGSIENGVWKKLGGGAAAGNFWALDGNGGTTPVTEADLADVANADYSFTPGTKNFLGTQDDNNIMVATNSIARLEIGEKLTQTVGQADFDFVLDVYGKARFRDGIVTSNSTYPDYVFDNYFNGTSDVNPNYTFKSLEEIEEFIKTNKHLPGVTSIEELNQVEGGYEVDNAVLAIQTLEKVEELYLHVIEQQKEIKALKAELAEVKK